MAATTASTASARIESRRWPPVFISPGPSTSFGPRSRLRAMPASADSRTSSARARVSAPSSAFGQCRYSASATNWLTSASPRNSSRSLCGLPALRWVSACASSAVSANACPANARGVGSLPPGTARHHLFGVELADHVQVRHQVLAAFVVHGHLPPAVGGLDLQHLRLDDLDVVALETPAAQIADLFLRATGCLGILRDRGQHLLDRVVLDVHRHDLHRAEGEENAKAQHHQESQHGHATLRLLHSCIPSWLNRRTIFSQGIRVPMRETSTQRSALVSKFIHTMNALPRRLASGRNPQNRLSS